MTTKRKRRKKHSLIFRRVRFILLIVLLALCVSLFTPLFHIRTVQVIGNEALSSEQIIETALIPLNENIFKLNKRAVRRRLKEIPEVEAVKIQRMLPSKVKISITETAPVMYFDYLTGAVATNENGRAMAVYDDKSSLDLLYVTGLEIKNVEICEKISVQDAVKFDIMIDMISKFKEKGLLGELRSCHFDNLTDFHVFLKDGTKIIFGKTSDFDYKLSMLSAVITQVNRAEGTYIDLSVPEKTVYGLLPDEPAPEENPDEAGAEENKTEERLEDSKGENESSEDSNEGTKERD